MVAAKCDSIHIMGTRAGGVTEFNIENDRTAAIYVSENSPVPLVWSQFQLGEDTMHEITDNADLGNPFRKAWALSAAQLTGGQRQSWDLNPTYFAIYGEDGNYLQGNIGNMVIASGTGFATFTEDAGGNSYRILADDTEANIGLALTAAVDAALDAIDDAILDVTFETETDTYIAAMTTPPADWHGKRLNQFFAGMKVEVESEAPLDKLDTL